MTKHIHQTDSVLHPPSSPKQSSSTQISTDEYANKLIAFALSIQITRKLVNLPNGVIGQLLLTDIQEKFKIRIGKMTNQTNAILIRNFLDSLIIRLYPNIEKRKNRKIAGTKIAITLQSFFRGIKIRKTIAIQHNAANKLFAFGLTVELTQKLVQLPTGVIGHLMMDDIRYQFAARLDLITNETQKQLIQNLSDSLILKLMWGLNKRKMRNIAWVRRKTFICCVMKITCVENRHTNASQIIPWVSILDVPDLLRQIVEFI